MNPIELLLKYPGFAQQLIPQMRPNVSGVNQNALNMAMQMSTPLMMGGVIPKTALLDHAIAGRILNTAEKISGSRPTAYMNLIQRAGKFLKGPSTAVGLTAKQAGKFTQNELFDVIGKMIREKK